MNRKFRITLLALTLFAALGSKALVAADTPAKFDVKAAIAAGDHQGLANYYKSQADYYRQQAAMHENMTMDYKGSHVHYKGIDSTFVAHCSSLRANALKTAAQYDDLAKEEEKLAGQKPAK